MFASTIADSIRMAEKTAPTDNKKSTEVQSPSHGAAVTIGGRREHLSPTKERFGGLRLKDGAHLPVHVKGGASGRLREPGLIALLPSSNLPLARVAIQDPNDPRTNVLSC